MNGLALSRWLIPTLLCAILATAWLSQIDFVPAGPTAAEPGFGSGSDWDLQWSTMQAGRSAVSEGRLPHWDPFPDFGAPVLAHPESFVAHPAWLLGSTGDASAGVRYLHASAALALFLGFAWLAAELSIPWFVGIVAAAAVVASFEWEQRVYSGHLMFLGTAWWPAALAGVARSLRRGASVVWAGVGGAAIGLGSLGGGHYPTLFAGVLIALVAWASIAKLRWQAVLIGLSALGLVGDGPPVLRGLVPLAAAAALVIAVVQAQERRRPVAVLAAAGAGLFAVAGFRLVPGFLVALQAGRVDAGAIGRVYESVPLRSVLGFAGGLEGVLHLAWPLLGAALIAGLVGLGARRPESRLLVVPVAVLTLVAWGSGGAGTLWPLLHVAPGLTGINYPLRLQWVFLYFAPFALGWLVWAESRALPAYRQPVAGGVALLVAAALVGGAQLEDRAPPVRDRSVAASRVTGVLPQTEPPRHLGLAARDGLIRAGQATALGFGAPDGEFDLAPVHIDGGRVSIEGRPGDVVTVPQRHLAGWTCEGGSLAEPDAGQFLVVTLQEPSARCEFKSPGLRLGIVLQLLGALALVGYASRRSRGGASLARRTVAGDVQMVDLTTPAG